MLQKNFEPYIIIHAFCRNTIDLVAFCSQCEFPLLVEYMKPLLSRFEHL